MASKTPQNEKEKKRKRNFDQKEKSRLWELVFSRRVEIIETGFSGGDGDSKHKATNAWKLIANSLASELVGPDEPRHWSDLRKKFNSTRNDTKGEIQAWIQRPGGTGASS